MTPNSIRTLDTARMRAQNSGFLLNLIWQERTISRAELSRRTGLSRSTVSEIVGDLLATALVRESGAGDSSGGRPPTLLSFCDDAFVLIGVEMAVNWVNVVATDLRGCVRASRRRAQSTYEHPEPTLKIMRKLIDACLADLKVPTSRVLGIGVGVACPIDPNAQHLMHPRLLPQWEGFSIPETLERAYGCAVHVDNDANLGAVAERWWGAGIGGEDLAFIMLETGVGAGLIINGQLYRGSGGSAGELGHTAIDPRGPRCRCGLSGCLGAMVGSPYLIERAEALLKEGRPSRLTRHGLTLEAIVDAAHVGDPVACYLIGEAGKQLGIGVASLLNLLNPPIVVLGGHLAAAGDLLLAPIRDTLRHRTLWKSVAEARIMTSMLGENAIALGAATRVLEVALEDPTRFPESRKTSRKAKEASRAQA
jgi:predicted NBD/HSP70 family sugar kinase